MRALFSSALKVVLMLVLSRPAIVTGAAVDSATPEQSVQAAAPEAAPTTPSAALRTATPALGPAASPAPPAGRASRSDVSPSPGLSPSPLPSPSPPAWPRPRSDERSAERARLVEGYIARGPRPIRDEKTLNAMRAVPRHWFVPPDLQHSAYDDTPLPIGYGQTISQPYIVAFMTEALRLAPGDRVLEIGTGSGYQAAVLNELTPHVYTIEIIAPLAARAAETFRAHGYTAIRSRTGDGYFGWPEAAPFDAIIVTAAAGHVPPPLIGQLKPGGRMIIPIGGPYDVQELVLIEKSAGGRISSRSLLPVRFVPLTGGAEDR
ncbi:MAG: hypothetical protein Kow0059_18680 [Candidatus Sumerlaeia bacterium]